MTERKKVKAKNSPSKITPPTEREIAQRERQKARNMARPERPKSELVKEDNGDGGLRLIVKPAKGQDEKLYSVSTMEALGTRSIPFINSTLDNILRVLSPSRDVSSDRHNAAVAIMAAVEPENELEATLAAQMVASNECAMSCMRAMMGSQMVDHTKMYGDLANKFQRTFVAQVEALAKLRRKGEQIVKHIHVHDGGQAVVAGTINQTGGRGRDESNDQPHGAEVFEACAALSGPDAARNGVPIPSHAEREMQASWGAESGSA